MKQLLILFVTLFALVMMIFAGCEDAPRSNGEADLSTNIDSVSYSLGYFYGSSMAAEGITEFNFDNFLVGFQEALEEQDPGLSEIEMQMAIQQFQMELQQRQQAEREDEATVHIAEGEEFLAENAGREDVNVTESGLQYRVIEEGDGERPTAESIVSVHYRGTLLNGDEFDSSYSRGEPAEFPLNQVIQGWTEGVQLMREGATYEFFIPADLAYGNNPPRGSMIAPGAVLIFEVELLEIVE